MDELEKLKKLLHHWQEHNDEHAEVYKEWAEKAASFGKEELATILNRLYEDTNKLKELLEKAASKI